MYLIFVRMKINFKKNIIFFPFPGEEVRPNEEHWYLKGKQKI